MKPINLNLFESDKKRRGNFIVLDDGVTFSSIEDAEVILDGIDEFDDYSIDKRRKHDYWI